MNARKKSAGPGIHTDGGKNQYQYTTEQPVCQDPFKPMLIWTKPTPYGGVGVWHYKNGQYCAAGYNFWDQFYGVTWSRSVVYALTVAGRIHNEAFDRYQREKWQRQMAAFTPQMR